MGKTAKLVIISTLTLGFASIILFVVLYFSSISQSCTKFKNIPVVDKPDCGYLYSTQSGDVHFISGRVVKVNSRYLELFVGRFYFIPVIQKFNYSSSKSQEIAFTKVTDADFTTNPADWESEVIAGDQVKGRIGKGDEIVITLDTRPTAEVPNYQNFFSKKDSVCRPFHTDFIEFLKNPSLGNLKQVLVWKYIKGCSSSTSQFYY